MMIYERNSSATTNHSLTFDTGKNLLNFDCHSIAFNDQETRLLLVGNHDLAFINFETTTSQIDHIIGEDGNTFIPSLSDIKLVSLFDTCNINRPIVEWNHCDTNQYAVAIDRIVRVYTVDHSRINETNMVIDSHHQRPISTISYSPHDPCLLLTGSLDGQIQVWDTRNCTSKSPANLKFTQSTPFSIRRIQWSSTKSENSNQLAVQCDRSIRLYDIRRTDSCLFSSTDLEHTQRIISMDWTKQNHSIATLSLDHSIRMFSTSGQIIAESLPNEQSPYTFSKIRTTAYDNLFICASRDTTASASAANGFVGWRWDEDQYLRPLTDHILTITPSPIVDFCFVTNPRLLTLFNNYSSSRLNDESVNRFLLLTWCRDGHLYLIDMDSTFRQAWTNQQARSKKISQSDSSSSSSIPRTSSNLNRQQQTTRISSTRAPMDAIKDEVTDGGETDDDDFQGVSMSPDNTMESSDPNDEISDSVLKKKLRQQNISCISRLDQSNDTVTEVSVKSELNSLQNEYGPYITVEGKDEQRRMCVVRCLYSSDHSLSFRIYLFLSRHYPTISQLFVRFKLSTIYYDERVKPFQSHIQKMFDEVSSNCFYHGQLCLHKCLIKLKSLFDIHHKQENILSSIGTMTGNSNKKREQSLTSSENDSSNGILNDSSNNINNNNNANINNNNNTNGSNRIFGPSLSARTSSSQTSGASFGQASRRTCGARFSSATHLVCFGQISNGQQMNSASILAGLNDGSTNRPQSLPLRSTSLTVAKSRENSTSIEQSNYRPPTTNTMQIQQTSNAQRLPMFSAPVRSTLGTSVFNDHQRMSSYRPSLSQLIHPCSTVSIYDVSILLPVSKKLADDYKIEINNPIYMCEENGTLTQAMGKDELAHCWRLLNGLLDIQPNLQADDPWFQTPIAQGLIKHLVSNYVMNGDIQSASMFLLTMSQTPYLKTKFQSKLINEHNNDPVLYSYACLLHRWKHFYRRTQILSQIDHNCQSPAPINQISPITTAIICSICLKPVLGQHFLCASCGHGGHLTHMHEWFSSDEPKHRLCPEKDCICKCILKQQELLTLSASQMQQQTPTITTPRSFFARQPSGGIRPIIIAYLLKVMFAQQRISPLYTVPMYGYSAHKTVPYYLSTMDINWTDTWPTIRTILLSSIMFICSLAVIGLDIANLAIEGSKTNTSPEIGMSPAKVGAGIWCGSISFLAALFIFMIIFVQNKRIAATFALIAVTFAFFFTIVLVGLTANSIQIYKHSNVAHPLDRRQYKLIIAILSIGLFLMTNCIIFFLLYIRVFFSSLTRRSTTY
ncbi:unnamed protein product [Adineta steineri]|uniref:Uncharacterized protein n=1 Tax=Adineta steineri TaxID=433720 RepID=A0A814MVR1_9BILA|nr:unnamed protein product [Adineta steineri]CAF1083183.1 unnamed protein product [Adineta steineri]